MVTDNGIPQLSSTTRIVITVDDINDHSPEFDQKFYKVQIPSNAIIDQPLFQVSNFSILVLCCLWFRSFLRRLKSNSRINGDVWLSLQIIDWLFIISFLCIARKNKTDVSKSDNVKVVLSLDFFFLFIWCQFKIHSTESRSQYIWFASFHLRGFINRSFALDICPLIFRIIYSFHNHSNSIDRASLFPFFSFLIFNMITIAKQRIRIWM